MRRFNIIVVVLVLTIAVSLRAECGGSQGSDRGASNIHYIQVPLGLSSDDVRHPTSETKNQLYTEALESLKRSESANKDDFQDKIVVFVESNGLAILPDLEATQSLSSVLGNELSFTFDSPLNPWTVDERAVLQKALADFYPIAKTIYGAPAFNLTVNIRKDPTIGYSGLYFPSLNEIIMQDPSRLDVLGHEMIHAFRDDLVIALPSFEEGMTRAAEIELFNRLPSYAYWDRAHSYAYDVFYEILNTPDTGTKGGQILLGAPGLNLVRYQLAGYAWGKGLIQNSQLFSKFNSRYYSAVRANPAVQQTETSLLQILTYVQSSIEETPTGTWYANQGVLNTQPATGYFLYQRSSDFIINFFQRLDTGMEVDQGDQVVQWEVYDANNNLLDSGNSTTSSYGLIGYYPTVPADYVGRLKLVARASTPNGPISSISYQSRSYSMQNGVFGISKTKNSGSVKIVPYDRTVPTRTVNVVNGAFSIPALETVRGRFTATLRDSRGKTIVTKSFNKDASDYFLCFP